ncbi:MAG TPA: DNA repair protein RadA [Spirochaetota bacterium]|nr:DNA repair protein RadA [Spirochaetota bacterium]
MARKKNYFVCSACGADYSKWNGRCEACGEWNTIVERTEEPHHKKPQASAVLLSSVEMKDLSRRMTGIGEFDLVCGGGIVPGSVILLGGEPGIGKSTLALQVSERMGSLYISGEESPVQIRQRAERLGINLSSMHISVDNDVEDIIALAGKMKPGCLIVDSIQTVYNADIAGITGSVSQVRESASRLADFAKKSHIPVVLIGHITKDGSIAGPKLLEHIVDTVLYFEGDFARDFRVLRAFKNRYGSVNELGLFSMTESGLREVKDKNRIFLNPFRSVSPGNAVSAAIEGSRTILFEVQSLVTFSSFSNPRRMTDGFDINRLLIISAVLEKHAGLKLSTFDIFLNVSGGFNINETAADLAVAMAVASSLKEKPIDEGAGFIGEISLSGELRPVSQVEKRVQEFRYSGFKRIYMSQGDLDRVKSSGFEGEYIGLKTVRDVMDRVF